MTVAHKSECFFFLIEQPECQEEEDGEGSEDDDVDTKAEEER